MARSRIQRKGLYTSRSKALLVFVCMLAFGMACSQAPTSEKSASTSDEFTVTKGKGPLPKVDKSKDSKMAPLSQADCKTPAPTPVQGEEPPTIIITEPQSSALPDLDHDIELNSDDEWVDEFQAALAPEACKTQDAVKEPDAVKAPVAVPSATIGLSDHE